MKRWTKLAAILACACRLHAFVPTEPLPVARVEVRIDDKSFFEMAKIYQTPEMQAYRAAKLAAAAKRLAREFQPYHPFLSWTGVPESNAQVVFIVTISERNHVVTGQWQFYPQANAHGKVGSPCVIFEEHDNERNLQKLDLFADAVVDKLKGCVNATALDPDRPPRFHEELRTQLKTVAIAQNIDPVDDDKIVIPLQWTAFYPSHDSLFRLEYWGSLGGAPPEHGIVYLGNVDRDSPKDTARVRTVPHLCDDHQATFDKLIKSNDMCHCDHKHAANAATRYPGLLQTMQQRDGKAQTLVYVEIFTEDRRTSAESGTVDTPDRVTSPGVKK